MTYKEILELIKVIDKSHLSEFKIKEGEFELLIRTDRYNDPKAAKYLQAVQSPVLSHYPVQNDRPTVSAPEQAPKTEKEQTQAPAADASNTKYLEIKSPMVGTFYRSSSPDKPAFVKVGDSVDKGSVVCIVEAMKLFNEIESDIKGKVVKVMVDDATPVEYDQVLFLIDPS